MPREARATEHPGQSAGSSPIRQHRKGRNDRKYPNVANPGCGATTSLPVDCSSLQREPLQLPLAVTPWTPSELAGPKWSLVASAPAAHLPAACTMGWLCPTRRAQRGARPERLSRARTVLRSGTAARAGAARSRSRC
eukprot:6183861-Pleurochrysis_carterae.AAC.2